MKTRKTFCIGLTAALAFVAAPALAQVYAWRDPATRQSGISNIPPPWYSRSGQVRGPRVLATIGDKVIDDTALPYEQRLLLAGKPKASPDASAPQQPARQLQAGRWHSGA